MMRRGQVALYLLMTIVVLAIVCFMNADVFLTVRAKNRVQNAGDAATLAAARVQGELLNEIGKLNIRHIVAACRNDSEECRSIELDQKKVALLGPARGWNGIESALRAANEAAIANGAEVREDFTELLREHVVTIRTVYSGGVDQDGDPYPEPWEGAWTEYASAIEDAIAGGLAFGPDNNEYYNAQGGHLLLNPQFYSAIGGRCWCWFHFHAENALKNYGGWSSWGPLPSRKTNSEGNSEIFSLHVEARTGALTDVFSFEEIAEMASVSLAKVRQSSEITNTAAVWFYFESGAWSQWFNGLRLAGQEDSVDGEFPIVGEVKRAYNVRGAAAVCRCIFDAPDVMDESATEVEWSAAAKPFGKVVDNLEGDLPVTARKYFVLPAFEAVRLVPLDAVAGESLSTADIGWVHHVRNHLQDYLLSGPQRGNGCSYCQSLCEWEKSEFHQTGTRWLEMNAGTCVRSTSGGCCSHGGTRHGH